MGIRDGFVISLAITPITLVSQVAIIQLVISHTIWDDYAPRVAFDTGEIVAVLQTRTGASNALLWGVRLR